MINEQYQVYSQLTTEQQKKIQYHAKQYNVSLNSCTMLVGCLGLPSAWVSLAVPKGNGKHFVCGIDPQGNTSS